jgi:hypothetical protein
MARPEQGGRAQPVRGLPSTAAVVGHPIHPMLIPFPITFLTAALATDVAARHRGSLLVTNVALDAWCRPCHRARCRCGRSHRLVHHPPRPREVGRQAPRLWQSACARPRGCQPRDAAEASGCRHAGRGRDRTVNRDGGSARRDRLGRCGTVIPPHGGCCRPRRSAHRRGEALRSVSGRQFAAQDKAQACSITRPAEKWLSPGCLPQQQLDGTRTSPGSWRGAREE